MITGIYRSHRRYQLTDKDTIVVADFANSTGDPVFDDTFKTALTVSLNQSPFLNVLSEDKVASTLNEMTRPAGAKLTPEIARELCQRAARDDPPPLCSFSTRNSSWRPVLPIRLRPLRRWSGLASLINDWVSYSGLDSTWTRRLSVCR